MVDFWTWMGTFFTTERITAGLIAVALVLAALLLFNKFWKNKAVPKDKIPPLMPE